MYSNSLTVGAELGEPFEHQLGDFALAVVCQLVVRLVGMAGQSIYDTIFDLLLEEDLAVAAIGLVEAMSIGRSVASQTGQRLDSNQEFVGQGLASIFSGFLSGYAVSGSFTRTAVNHGAGARSPMASVFSGLWVLVAMILLAPLAVYLPRAALAGVLLVSGLRERYSFLAYSG